MPKKALVLILAYNAQNHIADVMDRLPSALWEDPACQVDVIVIDDCSKDRTLSAARAYLSESHKPVRLLRNAINQGYGGNQKVGYQYAIEQGYDAVAMMHGDGQYPPEMLPDMLLPILHGEADAVFGSRMLRKKDALKGGMPYYKFAGNIMLTFLQNLLLGSRLSEFHTGYRAYNVEALKRIPFSDNSNVFHFDTDIIIQFIDNGLTIREIPIPTHYGDEICHVNGMRYAFDVMVSTILSRIQKFGIFYAPKFDYASSYASADKTSFISSQRFALQQVEDGQRVLDIGGSTHVGERLRERGCAVETALFDPAGFDFSALQGQRWDAVLLLDVLAQMESPERFLAGLRTWYASADQRVIITVPNVAFFVVRFMLFLGQFNYGRRGILDMRHRRLFTFAALKRLFASAGFNVIEAQGIPAPFPLAFGDNWFSRALLKLNLGFIRLSKGLFSYQIGIVAQPVPTLHMLVEQAIAEGEVAQ